MTTPFLYLKKKKK